MTVNCQLFFVQLLRWLNCSEVLETFLHSRHVGQTRFSLEGNETAIPLLAELLIGERT